jgi:hypothetical protein
VHGDELADIGKKDQFRLAIALRFDDAIEPGKGIVVTFCRRKIRSHELGQELVGGRLAIPPIVGLREQNKRIAEVFGSFTKVHRFPQSAPTIACPAL